MDCRMGEPAREAGMAWRAWKGGRAGRTAAAGEVQLSDLPHPPDLPLVSASPAPPALIDTHA